MGAKLHTSRRVVFITKYFHPYIGGMEKQALTLAAALAAQGWHITVITARINADWPAEEQLHGVHIVRLPSAPVKFFGALLFLFHVVRFLCTKRSSFELIHAFQVGYTSCIAALAAKLLKKKIILKLACSGPGGDVLSHTQSLLGLLFLAGCKRADSIIALNTEVRQELVAIGYPSEKIVSIPNCVDTGLYRPAEDRAAARKSIHEDTATKIILYTGRILFIQKRLDLLVRAFSKLDSAHCVKLYILGNGPDASMLEKLCEELNLSDKVCIWDTTANIAPYLQAADTFVLPSEYEGISNSILEAMATGLPIIATDITGNRSLLERGQAGILFPPGDEASLLSAMQTLLRDGEKAAALGRQARAEACRAYSIDCIVPRYLDLYGNTLEMQT